MAQSIRLTAFDQVGNEVLDIEPDWWDIDKLDEVAGPFIWIVSTDNPSYTDRDADISKDAARRLHDRFRERLVHDVKFGASCVTAYANNTGKYGPEIHRQYVDHLAKLQSQLGALDRLTSASNEDVARFHICVFDWDSGL